MTRDYTSARLQALHGSFQYGLIEARIKVPAGKGLLPAFWTLGNNAGYESHGSWPGCGEIDTMEVSRVPRPTCCTAPFTAPGPGHGNPGEQQRARAPPSLASGFHVYGVEWETRTITFMLDGRAYETITPADLRPGAPWPFEHPFFLLLDLAVGGEHGRARPTPPPHFPAQMLVDWVRVWQ